MGFLRIGLLLIFASVVGSAPAQIVDEFSPTLCSDDLRARIDNFFVLVADSPGSKGSVNIRSGYNLPGRAMKVQRIVSNHITFRGQDPERFRISIRHGGIPSVLFSLIPRGVEVGGMGTPTPSKVTYLPETLFDSSGIFKVNSREVQFGEESIEPCDFGLDLAQFAEAVTSEDDSVVHLLAASSRRISRAKTLTALKDGGRAFEEAWPCSRTDQDSIRRREEGGGNAALDRLQNRTGTEISRRHAAIGPLFASDG